MAWQCKIGPTVSQYGTVNVYDVQIMRLVGTQTYCTLRRLSPSLYHSFMECTPQYIDVDGDSSISGGLTQAEIDIHECNLTYLDVKRQLVSSIAEADQSKLHPVVKALIGSSMPPGKYLRDPPMATAWLIFIMLVMVSTIVYSMYILGAIHAVVSVHRTIVDTIASISPALQYQVVI